MKINGADVANLNEANRQKSAVAVCGPQRGWVAAGDPQAMYVLLTLARVEYAMRQEET